jgi:hypothetical protein
MANLVEQPYDKYWDGPFTRRDAIKFEPFQRAFDKMGNNTKELMAMIDTNCLVVNYLCEKLGVTREDLEVYVEKQKAIVSALTEGQVQDTK